jgi:type I restriction enzyme, S subunit
MVGRRDLCKAIESEGRVMSEWQLTVFGDLIDVKHGWAFKGEFFNETNHPKNVVVAIGNFNYSGGFRFDSTRIKEYLDFYPEEYKLTPGEILLAMTCQTAGGEILGIPGRIPEDGKTYLHNQRLGKIKIKNSYTTDSSFIYWLCLWHDFNHHLVATATGTKILHTAPERIKSFTFKCPPIDEQKQIGKTLDSLDRKISNLRQQNETLEKIAQTLFKHWFVDFEFPNEDGKPYKSSGGEMVRSELGEIPVGWDVCRFKECLEHLIDNRGKTPEFFSGGIPALSAKFVKGGDLVNRDSFNYVSYELFAQAEKLKIGDVILTSEAPLGETYFIARQTTYYPAQRVFALRADTNVISCSYLNYWLSSSTGQFFLKRRASGSTVQGIKQSELYQCEIIIPEKIIQCRASGLLTEILNKKEANSDQIQTLTQTRDRLLPKLMSGQLRIQD